MRSLKWFVYNQRKDVFRGEIGDNAMVEMTKEILDVINAVKDYKRYIISNNYIIPKDNFDWFVETEKYYHSLPLPEGMRANREDFERILAYDFHSDELERLNNTNYSDLHYTKWK